MSSRRNLGSRKPTLGLLCRKTLIPHENNIPTFPLVMLKYCFFSGILGKHTTLLPFFAGTIDEILTNFFKLRAWRTIKLAHAHNVFPSAQCSSGSQKLRARDQFSQPVAALRRFYSF